jgi:hypothetical protein
MKYANLTDGQIADLFELSERVYGIKAESAGALAELDAVGREIRKFSWPSEEWLPARVKAAIPGR